MSTPTVTASRRVSAPAERVYAIIADYRTGHPRILPPRFFRNLEVERGGVGAGTVIRFEMAAPGGARTAPAEITEPEPGRVLVERDLEGKFVTTFTVAPVAGEPAGAATDVTISTTTETRGGILGAVERWATAALLRPVYAEELALLAAEAEKAE